MPCDICGESIAFSDEHAEMYDPKNPSSDSVVCHADCGLGRGLEIA